MNYAMKLFSMILPMLLERLDKQTLNMLMDKMLDIMENAIKATSTPMDDMLILPILTKIRESLGIEDNDEEGY